jgi:hypothetical protein
MHRRWRMLLAVVLLIAGVAAVLLLWKPWVTSGTFVTAEELGYQIEYEVDPATQNLHGSNPDREGKEYVGVTVQGHYSVMILDGDLTVSREPRGAVRKGDRIKVTLDRRVWVNGVERRP